MGLDDPKICQHGCPIVGQLRNQLQESRRQRAPQPDYRSAALRKRRDFLETLLRAWTEAACNDEPLDALIKQSRRALGIGNRTDKTIPHPPVRRHAEQLEVAIRDVLDEGPVTVPEISARAQVSHQRVRRVISRIVKVKVPGHGSNAAIWELVS